MGNLYLFPKKIVKKLFPKAFLKNFSELHAPQGHTERALLKAAGVAPGKENRAELFRAQISIAVFVEEAVENLDDHHHYLYLHLIREPMIIIIIFFFI